MDITFGLVVEHIKLLGSKLDIIVKFITQRKLLAD